MVGSGTLSGSPLVKFLADFGRHLGPSRTQDGSQNDAKIIQKSMPKSFKKFKSLVKAPRWHRASQRRPQDAPKAPQDTPRTEKSSQNGFKFAPKSIANLIKCRNGLKARNYYFSNINLIFFYLGRHCFSNQKRMETVNKATIVLLKRFLA